MTRLGRVLDVAGATYDVGCQIDDGGQVGIYLSSPYGWLQVLMCPRGRGSVATVARRHLRGLGWEVGGCDRHPSDGNETGGVR